MTKAQVPDCHSAYVRASQTFSSSQTKPRRWKASGRMKQRTHEIIHRNSACVQIDRFGHFVQFTAMLT